MTVTVATSKGMYVFDEAQEVFIEQTSLNIHQSEDEYATQGWIIEGGEENGSDK